MSPSETIRIGLTGGIASGKSTVSGLLQQLGAVGIDTDKIARELVRPGSEALNQIIGQFGNELLNTDGSLRRERLAKIVFDNPQAKKWLEQLLHPLIKQRADELARVAVNAGAAAVVFDVPLLFESGWEKSVDVVWTVYVSPAIQRARLKKRDALSDAEISSRLNSQWPIEEKAKRSDIVINNEGTLVETKRQVEAAWNLLQQRQKPTICKGREA
jgi:dephospho-CoA kinase